IYRNSLVIRSFIFPVFFFFQAEDGIRDFHVTGVQTCALPIWRSIVIAIWPISCPSNWPVPTRSKGRRVPAGRATVRKLTALLVRSEERRVGKECSYRWSA